MNVTCAAPRESASMPTAPEPAQTSTNRAPSIRGERILKSVSRSRSEVGRTATPSSVFNRWPLYIPAIIRIFEKAEGRRQKAVDVFVLLPAPCLLLTAYCLLPTAYCLLLTAYCLLPTAYCLLLT